MAKSRLTPDYIEWMLKLNADQAAKEMRKINLENRELAKQQDATRKAMAQLEAEGKKGSKEWQNLKKSLKVVNCFQICIFVLGNTTECLQGVEIH